MRGDRGGMYHAVDPSKAVPTRRSVATGGVEVMGRCAQTVGVHAAWAASGCWVPATGRARVVERLFGTVEKNNSVRMLY